MFVLLWWGLSFKAFSHAQIDRTDTYPTIHNEPPWIPTDDRRVAVTAYFRDPQEICVCKGKCKKRLAKKPPIGDRLWIQMTDFRKKKNVMVIPLDTKQVAGTPWVEGTCVTAMGKMNLNFVLYQLFFHSLSIGVFWITTLPDWLKKSRCQSA